MMQVVSETPQIASPPAAERLTMRHVLLRLIAPLASVKLTVTLLGLSIFLVFAGTLVQVDKGIWRVMDEYFRTVIAWIELPIFFPRSWNVPDVRLPYPGGWLLGGLLLANLIAAHATRFTISAVGPKRMLGWLITLAGITMMGLLIGEVHFAIGALHDFYMELLLITIATAVVGIGFGYLFGKRCGISLLHAGLILLLASEGITGTYAVEGQMRILIGGSSNFLRDIRTAELAVIDPHGAADPGSDLVTTVSQRFLRAGQTIRSELLPFDIQVRSFAVNTGLVRADSVPAGQAKGPLVSIPEGDRGPVAYAVVDRPEVSGASTGGAVDMPAVDAVFKDKQTGQTLAEGRLSLMHTEFLVQQLGLLPQPQTVKVGEKEYQVGLRFKRIYKPYTLHLKEFNHEVYPGTSKPKDFSSYVRLTDASRGEDRDVRIWMNNPLRYSGETFFQSNMLQDSEGGPATGTVLQVVQNPGRIIPYLSCIMVAGGLVAHFFVGLKKFTERRLKA